VSEAGTPATEAGAQDAEAGVADAKAADAEAGASEAGASEAGEAGPTGAVDSGTAPITGAKSACIQGMTGSAQYSTSGMGLNLATLPNPLGGNAIQVPVNASSYTGLQFWIWGAGDSGTQSIIAQLPDKAETAGLGICDNSAMPAVGHECGGAVTPPFTVMPGWQFKQIPFTSFALNPGFGELNEPAFDNTSLTQVQWQIQEALGDASSGVPFDFCVSDVSFY
jgi:hypothetical protein